MLDADWTQERAGLIQKGIDEIFENQASESELGQLRFSFTIADTHLEGCPLIGCSTGFGDLCGYEFNEIVGRNCRFLVDPVPQEFIDLSARHAARQFCMAVASGSEYKVPDTERRPWMPEKTPHEDGIFLVQTNSKKDGTLFKNMFYLKPIGLDEKTYIVGLQTELDETNPEMLAEAHAACKILDRNMSKLETLLAGKFWLYSSMRRQEVEEDDGYEALHGRAGALGDPGPERGAQILMPGAIGG